MSWQGAGWYQEGLISYKGYYDKKRRIRYDGHGSVAMSSPEHLVGWWHVVQGERSDVTIIAPSRLVTSVQGLALTLPLREGCQKSPLTNYQAILIVASTSLNC
jgi:hypothetical protein